MRVVNKENLKRYLTEEERCVIPDILHTIKNGKDIANTLRRVGVLLSSVHYSYFGVEYMHGNKAGGYSIFYINAGDMYVPTILYYKDKYRIGCVGDILEKYMK